MPACSGHTRPGGQTLPLCLTCAHLDLAAREQLAVPVAPQCWAQSWTCPARPQEPATAHPATGLRPTA